MSDPLPVSRQPKRRNIPLPVRVFQWYRRQRLLNRLAIWIAILSLPTAVLAYKVARPIYKSWKQKNALALADACLKKKDLRGAMLAFRQAIGANPKNPLVWRRVGDFLDSQKSPEAAGVWEMAAQLQPQDAMPRYRAAKAALAVGDWQRARNNLNVVPKEARESVEYRMLSAEVFRATRQLGKAEAELLKALETDPGNAEIAFRLDAVRLMMPDPGKQEAAKVRLRDLADGNGPFATEALRQVILFEMREKQMLFAGVDAKELIQRPDAQITDYLAFLETEFATSSFSLQMSIQQVRERALVKPEDLMPVVNYFIQRRLAAEMLAWLEAQGGQDRPERRGALLELALATRDWKRTYVLLAQRPDAVTPETLARVQKIYDLFRTDQPQALDQWNELLRSSRGNLSQLAVLARLANAWGWPSAEEAVLWTIGEAVPGNPLVWKSLLPLVLKRNDTAGLLSVLSSLVVAEPFNVQARNLWLRTQFLLGRGNGSDQLRTAQESVKADPSFDNQLTYAVLLASAGQVDKAVEIVKTLPSPENPRDGVYIGYVYAKARDIAQTNAALELADAKHSALLPEEVSLITRSRMLAEGRQEVTIPTDASQVMDEKEAGKLLKQLQGERDTLSTTSNSRKLFETLQKESAAGQGADAQLKRIRQDLQDGTPPAAKAR
jgi:tetratricopeptide (TPR) repeat protein